MVLVTKFWRKCYNGCRLLLFAAVKPAYAFSGAAVYYADVFVNFKLSTETASKIAVIKAVDNQ
ncbi:hypothetical protein L1049_014275 [Liquidambar formosana]|uniref:Uncharacterized protein n=1 Tax=Liquidambar formosana TaxID=63359 RepID=A0AAP0RLP8_LIQFO